MINQNYTMILMEFNTRILKIISYEDDGLSFSCDCGECDDCYSHELKLMDYSEYNCVLCEDLGCEHCECKEESEGEE